MTKRKSLQGRSAAVAALLALSMLMTSAALVTAVPTRNGPSLAAIRAATARFHDVNAALAAGYVPVSPCVEAPGLGAMGIHYLNFRLADGLGIDPLAPEILLYVPSSTGLRLVAVEYWSIALANTAGGPAPWFGPTPPADGFFNPNPVVLGVAFEGAMEGHDPAMPWHYDRHVWIWQGNPAGIFEQFNPNLAC